MTLKEAIIQLPWQDAQPREVLSNYFHMVFWYLAPAWKLILLAIIVIELTKYIANAAKKYAPPYVKRLQKHKYGKHMLFLLTDHDLMPFLKRIAYLVVGILIIYSSYYITTVFTSMVLPYNDPQWQYAVGNGDTLSFHKDAATETVRKFLNHWGLYTSMLIIFAGMAVSASSIAGAWLRRLAKLIFLIVFVLFLVAGFFNALVSEPECSSYNPENVPTALEDYCNEKWRQRIPVLPPPFQTPPSLPPGVE